MTDDVVAELDHWRTTPRTAENAHEFVPISELLKRARDEIVALRGLLEHSDRTVITAVVVATPAIRAEALEEAARVCEEPARRLREELGWSAEAELLARYAGAIRALKDK